MPGRRNNLQSIGSLIGQAVAHGIMYGEEDRERILYLAQARDKAERFGRINDEEREFVVIQAIRKGVRQIREAERHGSITAEAAHYAQHSLDDEIDSVVGKLFPVDRGRYRDEVLRDDKEWDR